MPTTPGHLRVLESYLSIAPRSVDGTLTFAWTFGLVCLAIVLAAGGIAVDVLAFGAPRSQLGIAALGAVLGGVSTLWCVRMRRRRLVERARWHAAAEQLASSIGGRLLSVDATLGWLCTHWPHAVRVEDFAYGKCAHAIATPSALIHFEPEGTRDDSELPEAHFVVLGLRTANTSGLTPGVRTAPGFTIERVESDTVARLDADTCTRVFATPESLAEVTPLVRALLGS